MLNDDEKQRIIEEEIFRDNIRREVANKPNSSSWRNTMWCLVNSAFALWFLSTVAIGSIVWMYSKWEEKRAIRLKNAEIGRQLKNEIGLRLSLFVSSLYAVKEHDYDFESYSTALSLLNQPNSPEIGPRSLSSMAWELHTLVPGTKEKNAYAEAFGTYQNLETLVVTKSPGMLKTQIAENLDEICKMLNMLIMNGTFPGGSTPIVFERVKRPMPREEFRLNPQKNPPGKKTD